MLAVACVELDFVNDQRPRPDAGVADNGTVLFDHLTVRQVVLRKEQREVR